MGWAVPAAAFDPLVLACFSTRFGRGSPIRKCNIFRVGVAGPTWFERLASDFRRCRGCACRRCRGCCFATPASCAALVAVPFSLSIFARLSFRGNDVGGIGHGARAIFAILQRPSIHFHSHALLCFISLRDAIFEIVVCVDGACAEEDQDGKPDELHWRSW